MNVVTMQDVDTVELLTHVLLGHCSSQHAPLPIPTLEQLSPVEMIKRLAGQLDDAYILPSSLSALCRAEDNCGDHRG